MRRELRGYYVKRGVRVAVADAIGGRGLGMIKKSGYTANVEVIEVKNAKYL